MKKSYTTPKADLIRIEAKDIITISGFFGKEISFANGKNGEGTMPTIHWDDFEK